METKVIERPTACSVFLRALDMKAEAKKADEALKAFMGVIAPDSNDAFFENDQFTGFME